MISAWFNVTVKVQRRSSNPSRNALNEPSYGAESSYPVVYASMSTRIEYPDLQMQFTETGERVKLAESSVSGVNMFVDPSYTVLAEDRVTILTNDDASLVNQLYIVTAVYPEWDSIGNVHHFVAKLQVH